MHDPTKHTRKVTNKFTAKFCHNATDPKHPCMYAFCFDCHEKGCLGILEPTGKSDEMTTEATSEATSDVATTEVATEMATEMATQMTTSSSTKTNAGEEEGEAKDAMSPTATPKKRNLPQNCNGLEDDQTACSKCFKMHQ